MPRGGKRPGAGRPKGSANKTTREAREAFKAIYEGRIADLDRWIRETGDGFDAVHFLQDGTKIPYLEKNPGKAADLLTKMAEHFIPKIQRIEKTLDEYGDEELLQEIRRRRAEAERAEAEHKAAG